MNIYVYHPDNANTPISITLNNNNLLGRGGTASVYEINYKTVQCAVKIYNSEKSINVPKLISMIKVGPPKRHENSKENDKPQFGWPEALIKNENGKNIGYLMPKFDESTSFSLDHFYDRVLLNILDDPNEAALSFKLIIAYNLSSIVTDLHNSGIS